MKPILSGLTLVPLSFLLNEPAIAADGIEEIIITATPLEKGTDELVQSVSTLDREEITREAAASLGELLENEPGVTASSFARGASRPIIRGLDTFRVRVLENGTGSHDVSALSEDHGVPLDPLAAQRIEIIRGPAVLRYGSAAIGGAVSVLNNRVPSQQREGLSGEVAAALDSGSDMSELAVLLDGGEGPLAFHADFYTRDADDYSIPGDEPHQDNTAVESTGYAFGGSTFFPRGFAGLAWSHFESDYGVPGGHGHDEDHDDEEEEEEGHGGLTLDIRQDKFQFKTEVSDLGNLWSELRLEAAWSDYTHDEVDGETGEVGSTFDNDEGEVRLELIQNRMGPLSGAIGGQLRTRSLTARGEGGELLSPADMTAFAGFLFETVDIGLATHLDLGARIERVELESIGVLPPTYEGVTLGQDLTDFGRTIKRSFTPISASAGLLHHFDLGALDGITAGLTLQYTERAPDILELYAHGPHEATATFEIGNPNAGKEKAAAVEIALRRVAEEGRRLSFDLAWFRSEFDGFLYKADTGFVCGEEFQTCGVEGTPGVEDELRQTAYLQADTQFQGAEASISYRWLEWADGSLTLGLRYDEVSAEFDDGGNLPRIPPRRWGGSALLQHGQFSARLAALRTEEQNDLAVGETATPGYLNLKGSLSYTLERDTGSAVDIGITASNLLDEEIRNHVSFKKEDVLQPGRSFRLYMRARF